MEILSSADSGQSISKTSYLNILFSSMIENSSKIIGNDTENKRQCLSHTNAQTALKNKYKHKNTNSILSCIKPLLGLQTAVQSLSDLSHLNLLASWRQIQCHQYATEEWQSAIRTKTKLLTRIYYSKHCIFQEPI